ncbi:hypothetical protein C7E25_23435, partial [Stenotrophomonas maltophilia]
MTAWQQRQHLQQAIARQPGDFVAWVMLADVELEAGDIAAGEQAARRALGGLSTMTAWQQRQHLQQAIARQPGDFVAWVML